MSRVGPEGLGARQAAASSGRAQANGQLQEPVPTPAPAPAAAVPPARPPRNQRPALALARAPADARMPSTAAASAATTALHQRKDQTRCVAQPTNPDAWRDPHLRKFMPKMPATMAPSAAAKEAMDSRSSRRLTCGKEEAEKVGGGHGGCDGARARRGGATPTCPWGGGSGGTARGAGRPLPSPPSRARAAPPTSKRRAESDTPMDSSRSRAPASSRSASLCSRWEPGGARGAGWAPAWRQIRYARHNPLLRCLVLRVCCRGSHACPCELPPHRTCVFAARCR